MNNALAKAMFVEHTRCLDDPRLLELRSWKINELSYPIIDITFIHDLRRPLRIKLTAASWNTEPPSIELLDQNGSHLVRLPRGSGVLNSGRHPLTNRPFICTPGSKEYHTHPSHIMDYWTNYSGKSSFDLGGIITQIWNAWRKTHD